ncbi:hypothetical protein HanIR_Chr03g0104821 [Helianthus annuus]|nr:hypothetical protein HanIR_Chr03g0104821 [Helianthus annuus]
MKSFFWHGGSVKDAWFGCSSNQVKKQNTVKKRTFMTLEYTCIFMQGDKFNFLKHKRERRC